MNEFILRHGDWTAVTPESAGWSFVSFEVRRIEEGDRLAMTNDGVERALVPLSGDIAVEDGESQWQLGGRRSVFDGRGSCLYLPTGSSFSAAPVDGPAEVAICASRSEVELAPRLVTPADAVIEKRGAGNASRQVHTLLGPEFPAERLLVIEVWTPGGNWSSYPPHKHEVVADDESILEETYYYRTRDPWGFAYQRLYSPERSLDLNAVVRDGDLLQIPYGYHTTAAAHGCDLYYLNVLAGPNEVRTLQAAYDPSLGQIANDWPNLQLDPRVPVVD
jgi:5-deoxy-glucuronate isomerase